MKDGSVALLELRSGAVLNPEEEEVLREYVEFLLSPQKEKKRMAVKTIEKARRAAVKAAQKVGKIGDALDALTPESTKFWATAEKLTTASEELTETVELIKVEIEGAKEEVPDGEDAED